MGQRRKYTSDGWDIYQNYWHRPCSHQGVFTNFVQFLPDCLGVLNGLGFFWFQSEVMNSSKLNNDYEQ